MSSLLSPDLADSLQVGTRLLLGGQARALAGTVTTADPVACSCTSTICVLPLSLSQ